MINCIKITVIFLLAYSNSIKAQLADNSSTFRNLNSSSYFRFYYDNDYFTKTDKYYTQGITLDYVSPGLSCFFLSKLLWRPYASVAKYGVSINLFTYTPSSIASDSILYGDRPFNSNISVKTFMIQTDASQKQQVSTAFSIGIMGPWALGHEIQYGIHKWLKNALPHGWQYQIQNDIIINYQINYEKQLVSAGNNFLLNTTAEARVGTLNNRAGGGFNFMAGQFNKRLSPIAGNKRKAKYYFYAQGRVNIVGYDASLQGGLFNRSSPYTIAAGDISRLVFQADAGVIVNLKKLYLSYTQSYLTKEFHAAQYHRWGGISVGFSL